MNHDEKKKTCYFYFGGGELHTKRSENYPAPCILIAAFKKLGYHLDIA